MMKVNGDCSHLFEGQVVLIWTSGRSGWNRVYYENGIQDLQMRYACSHELSFVRQVNIVVKREIVKVNSKLLPRNWKQEGTN